MRMPAARVGRLGIATAIASLLTCTVTGRPGTAQFGANDANRDKPNAAEANASKRRVELVQRFVVKGSGGTRRVDLLAWIPRTEWGCQRVVRQRLPRKAKAFESGGNRYLRLTVQSPGTATTVTVTTTLELTPCGLASARTASRPRRAKRSELARSLKPERFIESRDPAIAAFADSVEGARDADPTARVRALYAAVLDTMQPGAYDPGEGGALRALERRTGDCTEYSDLLTAACRARGIPARVIGGLTTKWFDVPQHSWVEVYLSGIGWVALDPRHGERPGRPFDRLDNIYIRLSERRVDPLLDGYHYYRYDYFGDRATVESSIEVK